MGEMVSGGYGCFQGFFCEGVHNIWQICCLECFFNTCMSCKLSHSFVMDGLSSCWPALGLLLNFVGVGYLFSF